MAKKSLKKEEKKVERGLPKVSVEVVALAKGQHGSQIIEEGQKFLYQGQLNKSTLEINEGLPLWVEAVDSKFRAQPILDAAKKAAKPAAKKEDAPVAPVAPAADLSAHV
jgi:hypothetical protein